MVEINLTGLLEVYLKGAVIVFGLNLLLIFYEAIIYPLWTKKDNDFNIEGACLSLIISPLIYPFLIWKGAGHVWKFLTK